MVFLEVRVADDFIDLERIEAFETLDLAFPVLPAMDYLVDLPTFDLRVRAFD